MLHRQEPLHGESRLYGRVGVALGVAHLVGVVLDALHQAGFLQILGNLFAAIHAVHTHVEGALVADGSVGIENVDGLQMMRLAEHVVVGVVGGSHLQTARAELDVDIAVFDDGDNAVHQGYDDFASLQPLVLGVFGVDAHGGIAHDGLWAGGGHDGVVAALVFVDDVAFAL